MSAGTSLAASARTAAPTPRPDVCPKCIARFLPVASRFVALNLSLASRTETASLSVRADSASRLAFRSRAHSKFDQRLGSSQIGWRCSRLTTARRLVAQQSIGLEDSGEGRDKGDSRNGSTIVVPVGIKAARARCARRMLRDHDLEVARGPDHDVTRSNPLDSPSRRNVVDADSDRVGERDLSR